MLRMETSVTMQRAHDCGRLSIEKEIPRGQRTTPRRANEMAPSCYANLPTRARVRLLSQAAPPTNRKYNKRGSRNAELRCAFETITRDYELICAIPRRQTCRSSSSLADDGHARERTFFSGVFFAFFRTVSFGGVSKSMRNHQNDSSERIFLHTPVDRPRKRASSPRSTTRGSSARSPRDEGCLHHSLRFGLGNAPPNPTESCWTRAGTFQRREGWCLEDWSGVCLRSRCPQARGTLAIRSARPHALVLLVTECEGNGAGHSPLAGAGIVTGGAHIARTKPDGSGALVRSGRLEPRR